MPGPTETCGHCGEAIAAWELSPASGEPLHHECLFRLIAGSIGHQLGKCRCNGGTWDDPPELSIRQAARLALDYWREQNC